MTFICGPALQNGLGEHRHELVREITDRCRGKRPEPPRPAPVVYSRPASGAQIKYVADLGGDPTYAAKLSHNDCSRYLDDLIAANKTRSLVSSAPSIPPEFLELIKEGYYATRVSTDEPLVFYRVTRPTRGQYAGSFKVQTRHSDLWKVVYVLWPSRKEFCIRDNIKEHLLLLVADQDKARREYARELGACQICNKTLTDERSRYYGCGPECEKRHQYIFEYVDVTEGPYRPGILSTAR